MWLMSGKVCGVGWKGGRGEGDERETKVEEKGCKKDGMQILDKSKNERNETDL